MATSNVPRIKEILRLSGIAERIADLTFIILAANIDMKDIHIILDDYTLHCLVAVVFIHYQVRFSTVPRTELKLSEGRPPRVL